MNRQDRERAMRRSLQTDAEPTKMQSIVVDQAGDQWIRGRTWWRCLARVDGVRVFNVAKMHWDEMVAQYGPVRVLRIGK
ncbi:hypothetical protein [Microbacterium maritypicum]